MKITNSTDWPDYFLRRMVAWCCRQIGHKVRDIRTAQFKFTRNGRSYSGYAYARRFRVSIMRPGDWRELVDKRHGVTIHMPTRLHALIAITAHELNHCNQFLNGRDAALRRRGNEAIERDCHAREAQVIRAFDANSESLMAEWSAPPKQREERPKQTRQEKNEAKARALLATWERKLKLAKTKAATYRAKVRRYDRIAACRPKCEN